MWFLYTMIASCIWAVVNIFDSVLVHRVDKNPLVLMWFAGAVRVSILLCTALFVTVYTPYWPLLVAGGVMLFAASIAYLYVLEHVDTSVTQSAWAIESIMLSFFGFALLGETWSALQGMGAVLVLSAIFLLSYWNRIGSSLWGTLGRLTFLGLLGAPGEFGVKYALEHDVPVHMALFWYLVGSGCMALLAPLISHTSRRRVLAVARNVRQPLYWGLYFNAAIAFVGFAVTTHAYSVGPISLITIAGNVQPFIVILFAWLLTKTGTVHLPKELLTTQSVTVKLCSFALMFAGLGLMTT